MSTTPSFASTCLHHATPLSRQRRGIRADEHPSLVYLLGCFATWHAAEKMMQQTPTATAALGRIEEAVKKGVDPLMTTLRTYATQRPTRTVTEFDPDRLELASESEWFERPVQAPEMDRAPEFLEQEHVFALVDGLTDGASGYWLLGRLEALTGLQAAVAFARASFITHEGHASAVRQSIRQQLVPLQTVLAQHPAMVQLLPDADDRCPDRVCIEGLADVQPRVIVLDRAPTPAG